MPESSAKDSAAVERALAILEAVAHRAGGLSNADLSRRLKIPKSSASYLLRTLEHHGYLRREPESGRYRLGVKVLALSESVLSGLDIRQMALPILRHLVEHAHLTAHLAILDRGEAVYIEKVEAPGFIKMDTWVGRRMDVHATSVGKALIAWLPEEEVAALARQRGLRKRTPKTITVLSRLHKELEKVRAQGYAVDDEENNLGVRCVAAPIFNSEGGVEASLGVSGATNQLDPGSVPKMAEMVQDAARHIAQQMGYHPPRR
ncbi:MAG TPA: IclR family transcriptional regulator [Terriglobales bacterium]|nr:IclR family transcriptional regulator [Terriglobales bacterium]